ncbi:hypothetical protein [Clostridium manihotivorum]|uniref:Uncharacterized protein n=1 Tax=Clostridium manihotivorum TaxID=2320868 RepID=A0A3R5U7Y9_9CLOT|nr:hypothetical protein [Clostridium manihotivorum]QAA31257.1 hypothetical protein C1I91_06130 [Clostridium manihotivorum]
MNYNDIYEKTISIKKDIEPIRKTIEDISGILEEHRRWDAFSYGFLLNNAIAGGDGSSINNANTLRSRATNFHKELIKSLIEIDFMNLWMAIAELKKYDDSVIGVDTFIKRMEYAYGVIHKYKTIIINADTGMHFIELIVALNIMVNEFNRLQEDIKTIADINDRLTLGIKESAFSIRLLSENNDLGTTLESMKSLEYMYNDICSIIGISAEEEPIMYNRIESGTFLAFLSGNAAALGILGAIIKFSYEVYKDNFSWKARQDKALGDIKVRGEYMRLIKEQQGLNVEEKDLNNVKSGPEIHEKLARLEENNVKLFSNNPSIILNGENIGIPSMENKKIPETLLLKDEQKKIEELKDEEDKEDKSVQ